MRTVKWIFMLVVLSVVPSLSTLGKDNGLPFKHTACANGVDLTGQTVTFYHILHSNDEVDTAPGSLRAGYADATEYFNAHGGICGATVVQALDAISSFSRINPKPVLVALYSSGDAESLQSSLASDQIPALNIHGGSTASAYGSDGNTLGWVFAANPLYVDQIGSMCAYIKANPDRFPNPVIGFVDSSDGWATTSTHQATGYCQSLGLGYAGEAIFDNDSHDIHRQLQTLMDKGATILYTNSLDIGPALVARTLADMGLKGKVTLAAVNRAMDPYVAYTGEADLDANGIPVISGMIGSMPVRTWTESDNPGIQLMIQQADLHKRPSTMRSDGYIMGWDTTDLFIEVYIQTGNRVGFDHITGTDIKETLENIVYAPMGGVEQIDYQGGKQRALAANRIGEMDYLGQDGKTPASATNPPMIVQEGNQKHLVPMVRPLTDYQPAPDLHPGGADAPAGDEP
jgi:hypothetical protein